MTEAFVQTIQFDDSLKFVTEIDNKVAIVIIAA